MSSMKKALEERQKLAGGSLKPLPYLILAAAILIAWQVSDFDTRCLIVVFTALILVVLAMWHFIVKPRVLWHKFDKENVKPVDCGDDNCEICKPRKEK